MIAWGRRYCVSGYWVRRIGTHEVKTENDKRIVDAAEQRSVRNPIVACHDFHFIVSPSTLTLLRVRIELPSKSLIDLDTNGDRPLLGLYHNQVVVVGNIFDGSFEQASTRDDAQGNECSHDVDFAVRKAIIDVLSA